MVMYWGELIWRGEEYAALKWGVPNKDFCDDCYGWKD